MKNQWPFWLFVIAIIVVVLVSINYQGKDEGVSIGEIFPEGQEFDYEYVTEKEAAPVTAQSDPVAVQKPVVQTQAAVVQPVKPAARTETLAQPVAQVAPKKPVAQPAVTETAKPAGSQTQGTTPVQGAYSIQILSSQDKSATEEALKRIKANGFSEAYIRSVDLGSRGTWHRIYIGQFSAKTQAEQQLSSVKQKYNSAFVIKLAD